VPPAPRLTLRQLNRATLARQLLLERHGVPVVDAVERLAGLQAQLARPPFVGLWTRLEGFRRDDLLEAVHARRVVRATMMRGTLHLVSARDYARLRPALQPALSAGAQAILGDRTAGVDVDAVLHAARELYAERPRAFDELRPLLAARGLSADERALGYLTRMSLPLVQVPTPGAVWGWDAKAAFTVADSWLGAPPGDDPSPRGLVRSYLAAFGPATPTDAGAWSALRGLRDAFDALRPELVTFRDERGRELFDLPDAPRPDPDVEAPVRFLPEFDNLVLAHDDRTRVIATEHRPRVVSKNLQVAATVLVDGFVAGTWKVAVKRGTATLAVQPFAKLPRGAQRELQEEGDALLRFVEPDARGREVAVAPPA
jgi:hypothetical protein